MLQSLFNRNHKTLGLDIGASSIKAVHLEKDDIGFHLVSASRVAMSDYGGDIAAAITDCLGHAEHGIHNVVCGISGPDVVVRKFTLPSIPDEDVPSAVHFEAGQICPFDIRKSKVSHHIIDRDNGSVTSSSDNKIHGILVAATNRLIKQKLGLVEKSKAKCCLMDVDGLALLNCFSEYNDSNFSEAIAIIDIGGKFTNIVILGSDGFPFIRDLSFAGNDIVQALAAEKNMTIHDVEKALHSKSSDLNAAASFDRICYKLITDIGNTFQYYTTHEAKFNIEQIYVCGEFAAADGFVATIADTLNIKATAWNPFEKIRYKPQLEPLLSEYGSTMAVATGLAMRTI